MFSYYGSKFRLARYYPKPRFNTIIEPFCGAAWYSLLYFDKSIILNDLFKDISDIWAYIIKLDPKTIKEFPQLQKGEDLRDLNLDELTRKLLGFAVNYGVTYPHNVYTAWASRDNAINALKKRLLQYCGKLNHWKVLNVPYDELDNIEATWFIDPPYQMSGEHYIHSSKEIDYEYLAEWCKSRKGQVIVCEHENANWLPFKFFREQQGQRKTSIDVIWTN